MLMAVATSEESGATKSGWESRETGSREQSQSAAAVRVPDPERSWECTLSSVLRGQGRLDGVDGFAVRLRPEGKAARREQSSVVVGMGQDSARLDCGRRWGSARGRFDPGSLVR